jgi:hypothetical protein
MEVFWRCFLAPF